jgi:hypothetical protein
MKILAFILSLYILILTAIPCIDKVQDHAKQTIEIAQNPADHQHGQESDQCSPFCSCVCCATSVIHPDYSIHFKSFSFLQEKFSEQTFSFVSSHFVSIWQPPKLS